MIYIRTAADAKTHGAKSFPCVQEEWSDMQEAPEELTPADIAHRIMYWQRVLATLKASPSRESQAQEMVEDIKREKAINKILREAEEDIIAEGMAYLSECGAR